MEPETIEMADMHSAATPAVDDNKAQEPQNASAIEHDDSSYPPTSSVVLSAIALSLCLFIMGMDQTIVATAIPYISNEFGSLDQVGWYASAYLVASCLCQLLWGKAYKLFLLKRSYLLAVLIFEIGSTVCAAAPSSPVFILGRAISGVGAAEVNAGYGIMLTRLVPLRKRALYDTTLGGVYSVASVTAPLIGGALTSKVSWRWCFWLNFPCGAISAAAVAFFMKVDQGHEEHRLPLLKKIKEFDIPGAVVLISGMTCALVALQWGGVVYAWDSAVVISLLTVGCCLVCVFVPMQVNSRESALLPLRILSERNVACTTTYHVMGGASITICEYYLPLWFQAIKGASPLSSGVMLLPLIIGNLVAALTVGWVLLRVGYPLPFLIVGGAMFATGLGLLTTFGPDTDRSAWFIHQILVGGGIGLGMQAALMPAQIILSDQDVAMGIAIMNFAFVLGGALAIPIAQTIFANRLASSLKGLTGNTPAGGLSLTSSGVTQILQHVPKKDKAQAVAAYNSAVLLTFYMALATGIFNFLSGLGVKANLSVKRKRE